MNIAQSLQIDISQCYPIIMTYSVVIGIHDLMVSWFLAMEMQALSDRYKESPISVFNK